MISQSSCQERALIRGVRSDYFAGVVFKRLITNHRTWVTVEEEEVRYISCLTEYCPAHRVLRGSGTRRGLETKPYVDYFREKTDKIPGLKTAL